MDFAHLITPRIAHFPAFHKEETVKTFLFIILLLNLGYIALGWQHSGRRDRMTELGIYYCYAYRKGHCSVDVRCFEGVSLKASVDAQHWADEQIRTGEYSKIDVKDAMGNLIYSR